MGAWIKARLRPSKTAMYPILLVAWSKPDPGSDERVCDGRILYALHMYAGSHVMLVHAYLLCSLQTYVSSYLSYWVGFKRRRSPVSMDEGARHTDICNCACGGCDLFSLSPLMFISFPILQYNSQSVSVQEVAATNFVFAQQSNLPCGWFKPGGAPRAISPEPTSQRHPGTSILYLGT